MNIHLIKMVRQESVAEINLQYSVEYSICTGNKDHSHNFLFVK